MSVLVRSANRLAVVVGVLLLPGVTAAAAQDTAAVDAFLEPGLLEGPTDVWIDPAFGATPTAGPIRRAVIWFDRQLLTAPNGYRLASHTLGDEPRGPLRRRVIETLKRAHTASWAAARDRVTELTEQGAVANCTPHWIVNGFSCDLTGRDPAPLASVPGVRKIFRGFTAGAPAPRGPALGPTTLSIEDPAPYDPLTMATGWNLDRLDVPRVWRELGLTGEGVLVAIHDFGFKLDVAPLRSNLYRNPGEVADNGVDDDGNGYVDDVHGYDFDRGTAAVNAPRIVRGTGIHGNLTAAVVVGHAPADTAVAFGIAPGAEWTPILGRSNPEAAIQWALEQGVDIYSMSFSMPGLGDYRAHWRKMTEHAAVAGIFFVSGAGNFAAEGSANYAPVPVQMRVPEDIPLAVFGVTGLNRAGERPVFSSQGPVRWDVEHYREGTVPKPDFMTFNQNMAGIDLDGRYDEGPWAGNSFAGPHLAGVLALMLSADPDLTPWRARTHLIDTSTDVLGPGFDTQSGFGLLNAFAAVSRVVEARSGTAR